MTGNTEPKIGGLLLAAGGSSRLGRPKQLVPIGGKTLLRRAAETLADSVCVPVVVVLGAETELSLLEIANLPMAVIVNENWRTGMSTSIESGLRSLLDIEPKLTAVIITLCDQPYILAEDIDRLAAEFRQTNAAIVAAAYNDSIGVPALFSSEFFGKLFDLEGDAGARHLLRNCEDVITISMQNAAFDVDTTADLIEISIENQIRTTL